MILSQRERTIVVVTAAIVALLLTDRLFLTPVLDRRGKIEEEADACLLELQKADNLFAQKKRLVPRWREMTDSGLGTGAGAAESRFLHAIRDWAQEAELNLASVKLERTETERQFQKITWRAAGTGSMAAISRFLWRIQEAALPVRVSDVQIASRQEGADSLSIQVGVSTLCMSAKAEKERAALESPKGPIREEQK